MHNGEKDINTELDNLKLFFKMHVFMLLFHFFTEGLPKYDIDDADLPNQCKYNDKSFFLIYQELNHNYKIKI